MSRNSPREPRETHWSRRTREEVREAERIERLVERAEDRLDDAAEMEDDDAAEQAVEEAKKLLGQVPLPQGAGRASADRSEDRSEERKLDPGLHVRTGDCFFDLEMLSEAEAHYRRAAELDPEDADALHGLGMVHQAREEDEEMIRVWLEVRRLDLREKELPWAVTEEEFVDAAEAAFTELPAEVLGHLKNLPIVVCDYPDEDLVKDGVDPRSLGIITGIPFSHRRVIDGPPELDCVQLYRRNIERISDSKEMVLEEVRITVLHETAHYFGLSDDDLEGIGLG